MVRILFVIILCLMAVMAEAQQFVPAIEVRPWFARQAINFKDDQISSSFQKNRVEWSAAVFVNSSLHIKYTVIPGISFTEDVKPTNALLVGLTKFGGEKETAPISLEWSTRGEHRIELSAWRNTPIRPVVVGEWVNLQLAATSTKDGKTTADTEDFSRFIAAAGGMISYTATNISTNIILVGSRELQRFEARISYNGSITGGYVNETRDLGGVKIREHGLFLGLLWAF
jgi:hypothetical protein